MKNTKKKIFYEKEVNFYIIPNMIINDVFEFKKHVLHIRIEYQTQYQKDCFFWDFDEKTNSIIINENAYAIENDIFNQLTLLAHWLFKKNYHIKGSFHSRIPCGRTCSTIEHISMNGINRLICHYMLVDIDTTEHTLGIEYLTENMGNKIIIDAKNKIKKYIDLQKIITDDNPIKFNKNIISKIIIQDKTNYTHKNEEIKLVIGSVQKRVTKLESKQKTQTKLNKFFMRTFTIIGLLIAGSLICLSMNKKIE
jgi:hypothetical protein